MGIEFHLFSGASLCLLAIDLGLCYAPNSDDSQGDETALDRFQSVQKMMMFVFARVIPSSAVDHACSTLMVVLDLMQHARSRLVLDKKLLITAATALPSGQDIVEATTKSRRGILYCGEHCLPCILARSD